VVSALFDPGHQTPKRAHWLREVARPGLDDVVPGSAPIRASRMTLYWSTRVDDATRGAERGGVRSG
jgi:hypothetical protein